MEEIRVRTLDWEDPLLATHSSILAWRIPRTEESGRLQPVGSPSEPPPLRFERPPLSCGSCWHAGEAPFVRLRSVLLKKEFIGPGLHLRPVCADRAWPPLQWTPSSVLSACGNDKGRIRPPLGRGILKKRKQTLITPAFGQCLSKCNHRLIGY